jgi:hypothetical protein
VEANAPFQHAERMLAQVKEERNNLQRMVDELLDHEAPHGSGRARSASPSKQSSLTNFRFGVLRSSHQSVIGVDCMHGCLPSHARSLARAAGLGLEVTTVRLSVANVGLVSAGTPSTMVRTA